MGWLEGWLVGSCAFARIKMEATRAKSFKKGDIFRHLHSAAEIVVDKMFDVCDKERDEI